MNQVINYFKNLNIYAISLMIVFGLNIDSSLYAQWPGAGGGRPGGGKQMNIGRFYGKVVDEEGKGVGFASVQIWGTEFNAETKEKKDVLLTGQLTTDRGEFSLEKLPVFGPMTLKISVLGFAKYEQKVSFVDKEDGGAQSGGGGRPGGGQWGGGGMSGFDKDLGNIRLTAESVTLDEVSIEGQATAVTLALDKKIFRVDQNATSVGGTAIDALQNVPSLSVDLDGNLTLRNAAPQLFIDGRPTNLTLDQISADEIESVEVITNPSAKYDASGGQAGIVNIVLKKNRRIGYNGSIRGGIDTQQGFNGGGNLNAREGKVNLFLSANVNRRRAIGSGETIRENLVGTPLLNVTQIDTNNFTGTFTNLRGGVDWFVNNRNTLTFSGSYTRGEFLRGNEIDIFTDSVFSDRVGTSEARRISESDRYFQNIGASVLFKHLFPKEGKELTADINLNSVISEGAGTFNNQFLSQGFNVLERQINGGGSDFITIQTDYVEPLNKTMKVEAGLRAAIRTYNSENESSIFNNNLSDWVAVPNFADKYEFRDEVYAAYTTFSHQMPKWGYQMGLRVESSQYTAFLPNEGETFENDYPFSFFPSLFVTRKINDTDNLQFSYSRRIDRPSFFRLMPFTDFSDSLNLRRGNPNLLPEFTNSVELTYQNIINKNHDILVSAYFKQANDLMTTFQTAEIINEKEYIVTSYANSNSSMAYGVEITMRNTIGEFIELTSNVNLYNSRVDASNVQDGLINEQFTWFAKENLNIKLPASFRLQITGQYQSKAAFTPSSGGGRFSWRGVTNTAQGYTLPYWFVDVALRKDLFKRKASLTVNMRDVFRSRITGTYTETDFFIQDTSNLRNPQVISVNFSYRFGKPDMSLFKRKNNNVNMQGSDMM
jgi:outer membrane receptor protein involved in Fe transport